MENNNIFNENYEVTHGRGYVYMLQYHIVWCVKYRKSVFISSIADEVKQYLLKTADTLALTIAAMEVMPDHIHLLVEARPQLCIADAIKVFKGNTARWLFINHPELKSQLWGGHLWNPSYFVATVSNRSREQVEDYINSQK